MDLEPRDNDWQEKKKTGSSDQSVVKPHTEEDDESLVLLFQGAEAVSQLKRLNF